MCRGYRRFIVPAFIIEKDGEIKEKFSYEILFNRTTQQSLVAYSHANYGSEAIFRYMTDEEKADFLTLAQDFHLGRMIRFGTKP